MIDLRSLRLRPSFVVTVRTSRPHWPAATVLWLLAILITAASIVYQRCTGPTYPLRGTVTVGDAEVEFRLPRSETVGRDVALTLIVPERQVTGTVRFRRYRSFDDWTIRSLHREGDQLRAHLPEQPPAGKLMYFIELNGEGESVSVSGEDPVILRYKGNVPAGVLIPHIICMFLAMLWSNRCGIAALLGHDDAFRKMVITLALFIPGGLILGPIVQQYAFGALWTGFPFGHDLTDNKALVALIAWLVALVATVRHRRRRGWILAASLVMLAVYLIPHSLLGSELDYTDMTSAPQLAE